MVDYMSELIWISQYLSEWIPPFFSDKYHQHLGFSIAVLKDTRVLFIERVEVIVTNPGPHPLLMFSSWVTPTVQPEQLGQQKNTPTYKELRNVATYQDRNMHSIAPTLGESCHWCWRQ